ncbi:MAG: hypothetical protein CMC19_04925 [Flavobacteriaceae bacterium]|nr:hypothetical protein [Flavobacteriaceae bacterium]
MIAFYAVFLQLQNKMPTNLNALIRYKTIDTLLQGGAVYYSIDKLQIACSEALAEQRGVYKMVSERTIRDDIRVMRSDILGYNAPIIVKEGRYTYANPNFSIQNTSVASNKLLLELGALIRDEFGRFDQKRAKLLLDKIDAFTANTYSLEELTTDETSKQAPSETNEKDTMLYSIKVMPNESSSVNSESKEILWSAFYELVSEITFDAD